MATVIGLGVQFSANANGMTKGLSQVDRQLQNLGKQASQAARLFDGFASSSGAAATAQQQVATDIGFLTSAFKTGQISAQEYASQLQAIVGSAKEQASAFADGLRITEQYLTAEERREAMLAKLEARLQSGAISQETYNRAVADVSGANEEAARAEQQRASDQAKASQIIEANLAVAERAQREYAESIAELDRLREAGVLGEQDYADAVARAGETLAKSNGEQATRQELLREAERLNKAVASAESKQADELKRLDAIFATGVLSIEAYNAEKDRITGVSEAAAEAERQFASDQTRAAQIVEANLTAEERAQRDYAASLAELDRLRDQGILGEQDYAKAVERSAAAFAKATVAAARYEDAADGAGDAGVLKFNELSGVLAAIPGPIGNVAGRLSGLASAGEGLGRVFSGGIGQGLASIGTSVAGLVNPFTAGLAAVAAFGAGATAVARGLLDLEDRVENLGNIADKLGVSFEFIQTLEESANRSGTSIDAVSAAFGRLQKSVLGVDEESKAAQKALAEIGVTAEQLQSLSPEEQYKLIGDALSGIEDPARRTAAATALFGRAGADLLPFFRNLGPAASDIERLGGALSEIDRRRLDDFGAGLDALGVASSRLGELLLVPFAGLGEGIAQGSAEFLGGINSIVGPIGDVLEPVLSGLGSAFELVGVIIGGIGRTIGAVLAPIGNLAQAFGSVGEVFNTAFVDVVRYLVDASVATTEWVVSFTPLGAIAANVGAIGDTVSRVANIIGTAFTQVTEYISEVVASWTEFFGLQSAIETIGSVISSIFGGVSSTFETISKAIGGTVGRLLSIAERFLGIKNEVESPIVAELDLSQPALAATQFAKEIGNATTKASEFGEAGFKAALRYQEALEQVAQLQADGTFSAEEAKRAAEQAEQSFETTIAGLGREAEAQRKAAEEAQKAADAKIAAAERAADAAIQADQRRADSFIATQGLGGEDPATAAAENLLAVTRQIEEAEAAIVAARAAGDAAAEQAATRRLAILDQAEAAAQETVEFGFSSRDAARAIEEVRGRLDETFTFDNFEIAPEAFAAAQDQLRQLELDLEAKVIDPDTFEEAADAIRKGFDDALRTAEQIRDLNEQYAERAAEIDKERIDALSKVSQQPLQIEDVRTGAGISEFLRLATGREDPAIAEYRKQLGELQKIAKEINKLGGVVEIVGAN